MSTNAGAWTNRFLGSDFEILELLFIYIDTTAGLPLGYQTSQLFALMFLDEFDHAIKERFGVRYYGRQMDDLRRGWSGSPMMAPTCWAILVRRAYVSPWAAWASHASAALSTKAVGNKVQLKLNGVKKNFIVVHQGKPSGIYDASCDGTWLLLEDIYETRQWHTSSVNKLESSTIHNYLNSTFLAKFDANIQAQIKQVKLPYRQNGGSGGTDRNGANGLSCKIFLLSGYECGWTTSNNPYFPVDGAKLAYFEAGTGTSAKMPLGLPW